MKPDAVALLGDLQYQVGQYSDFEQSFDLTYGAFKFLQRPAPGNHEFYDEHGETGVAGYGYFSYFNGFQIDTTRDGTYGPDAWLRSRTRARHRIGQLQGCGNTPGATTPNPQPIPRADGQAGHFEERAESEPAYRRGAQSESEMAGTPIIWARGTLFRSI